MAATFLAALDVGTSTVQTIIARRERGEQLFRIAGVGVAPSTGVRRGVIVDLADAMSSIRQSVEEARHAAGVPIRSVWVALGGVHATIASSRGVVAVSRADQEISFEDVRRAIAAAETFIPRNPNREVLHMIPREFRVDQEGGIRDPVGMHGVRLETDTLVIQCGTSFLKNLFKCIEGVGLRVEDYVFAPLAAAEAVLTKRQKELGVMLLDIGGGTASFIVFEEGMPMHAGVIPIGGHHITNDVAIGFKTHVDAAEEIKRTYGSCLPEMFAKRDQIQLAEFIPDHMGAYSRRELAEIIRARLSDVFELVGKELKRIGRNRLLPAGVVVIGGSSMIPGLVELAREELGLPVERGIPRVFDAVDDKTVPSFAVALGTLQWAHARMREPASIWEHHLGRMRQSKFARWLKSLLP